MNHNSIHDHSCDPEHPILQLNLQLAAIYCIGGDGEESLEGEDDE